MATLQTIELDCVRRQGGEGLSCAMRRDRRGIAALAGAVPFLYVGWYLSWYGTFAGTCTGSDPKSLGAGMFLSMLPFATALFILHLSNLSVVGLTFALPVAFLLAKQAIWGAELFWVVNIAGRSACSLMMGEDFGEARGGWLEQMSALYYFAVSAFSIWTIGRSHWRFRQDGSR